MANSKSYLSQYKKFTQTRRKPEDYVRKYSKELGVDDLKNRVATARTAIRSTEETIGGVPDSVSGRTSGSLVTDAQRNRLVQNEVAPLQEILGTQTTAFGDAAQDYSEAQGNVDKRVGYALDAADKKAASLYDLYQAAFEREKQAEANRQWQLAFEETKRQNAASRAAAANTFSPSFGGGSTGGGGKTSKAYMTPKSNGSGYAFSTASGKSISAASYAKLTGQDIRDVLYSMGQSGDNYAAQVYNQLRNDPFFGKGNKSYDARIKSTYSPLFWGS